MTVQWKAEPPVSPEEGAQFMREAAQATFDLAMRDGQVIDFARECAGPGNRDLILTITFRHKSALPKEPPHDHDAGESREGSVRQQRAGMGG